MDKTVNISHVKPFTDRRTIDLHYQAVEHEISKTYNVEEIVAFLRLEFADSRGLEEKDQIPGPGINRNGPNTVKGFEAQEDAVSHNDVSEGYIQLREALCNPVSWIDVFLTIAAGLLIGFILFGAFLF